MSSWEPHWLFLLFLSAYPIYLFILQEEGSSFLQLLILEDPETFLPQAPAVEMFLMMKISSQLAMSI